MIFGHRFQCHGKIPSVELPFVIYALQEIFTLLVFMEKAVLNVSSITESCSYLSMVIAFFGHRSSQIPHSVHESQSTITGLFSLRLKTAMAQQSTQVYERQSLHLA